MRSDLIRLLWNLISPFDWNHDFTVKTICQTLTEKRCCAGKMFSLFFDFNEKLPLNLLFNHVMKNLLHSLQTTIQLNARHGLFLSFNFIFLVWSLLLKLTNSEHNNYYRRSCSNITSHLFITIKTFLNQRLSSLPAQQLCFIFTLKS